MKKTDSAVAMMQRAWKAGLRAAYALCDSWFTCEEFIHAVRAIGDGSVHESASVHFREACSCSPCRLYFSYLFALCGLLCLLNHAACVDVCHG